MSRFHTPSPALLALPLALLLGACTPRSDATQDSAPAAAPAAPVATAPVEAAPPPMESPADLPRTCDAGPVQALVGQEATEAVVAQATADSGSASVRVLKPDEAATMDYRQDRLNIDTSDAGIIQSLRCG